jgi:hypothetical protein
MGQINVTFFNRCLYDVGLFLCLIYILKLFNYSISNYSFVSSKKKMVTLQDVRKDNSSKR